MGLWGPWGVGKLHRRCSPQRSSPEGLTGDTGVKGEKGGLSDFLHFLCLLETFSEREAFQGIPGGHGYILTEFVLKQRHLDLVHAICHDFSSVTVL